MSNNQYFSVPVKLMAAKPPVFLEKSGKDWIYFGTNNDYPNYLIELRNRSVLHSTILSKKRRLICGDGWEVNTKGLTTLEGSILNDWIKQPNGSESLNETTKKICDDLETFDGFYLQVIYDKAQTKKKSVVHIPFQDVRRNKDNTEFYYTKNWFKTGANGVKRLNPNPQDEPDFKKFKPYDENKKGDKSQIYFYDCYSIGKDVYPLPNYLAGITAIETEARIDNFWLNFIKKGFTPAHMINLYNGVPPEEKQQGIKDQIKKTMMGDDADDWFIVNFCADKEHGSEVITTPTSDLDKQFQQLKETTQQSILQIHGVSNPTMLGIKTPGQLGSRDELVDALEEFNAYYISTRQAILEYVFNDLFATDLAKERMKIKPLQVLGTKYSEALIQAVIPLQALRDMVAEKLGIDLKKYDQPISNSTTQTTQRKFSEDSDGIAELFATKGFSKQGFKIKQSRDFEFTSDEDLDKSELLFKETFAEEKEVDKGIGLPPTIDTNIPTNTPKVELQVVYSYGGPMDSRNRAFCARMLSLDRYYTKEDMRSINDIIKSNEEYSSAFGDLEINVWKYRGGWYRKKGSDVSIPHCRHRFFQHLILKES